jgi:ArsR family transcriptional regulator
MVSGAFPEKTGRCCKPIANAASSMIRHENLVCNFAKLRNTSRMPVRKKSPVQVAAVFKALGHPARLKMVRELVDGGKCVCDLVEAAGLGWSTVSRHLSVLREAGVVRDEKRAQQVIYQLEMPCVGRFMDCLENPARFPQMHASCCGD